MIDKFYGQHTPICDHCEKTLPGQMSYSDAVVAIRAAGWETRMVNGEQEHICTDCLFEEKGYEK